MNLNRICLLGSVAGLISIGLLSSGEDVMAADARHDNVQTEMPSMDFSPVVSPSIPENVTFAGRKISLDPTHMWERLDRELTAMSYTHGNTLLAIKRANRYFPVLAPILERNRIPSDMLYLAAIESTLNPRAYSPAKAAGLWQFIPSTAKEYGLEVNENVDERYDVEKATEAACRYLRNAYAKYGNWESVAASYNGGMARITRELAAQQADSAYDLYLADETMRYIFRLLAMKMIMENPARYGYRISADALYQPLEYDQVKVDSEVTDWPRWASDHGIDYMTLREANPWIRSKSLPNKTGKTYMVKIPTKESLSRSKQRKTVYNPSWISE